TMTLHRAGESGGPRALEDIGPYTVWRITNSSGDVLDEYVKLHRPGLDAARRHLILQHYGAPTPYIDVTRDIRVAEWFAFNRIKVEDTGLATNGVVDPPYRDPAVLVFLALDGLAPVVDTERLTTPHESLRPHR